MNWKLNQFTFELIQGLKRSNFSQAGYWLNYSVHFMRWRPPNRIKFAIIHFLPNSASLLLNLIWKFDLMWRSQDFLSIQSHSPVGKFWTFCFLEPQSFALFNSTLFFLLLLWIKPGVDPVISRPTFLAIQSSKM